MGQRRRCKRLGPSDLPCTGCKRLSAAPGPRAQTSPTACPPSSSGQARCRADTARAYVRWRGRNRYSAAVCLCPAPGREGHLKAPLCRLPRAKFDSPENCLSKAWLGLGPSRTASRISLQEAGGPKLNMSRHPIYYSWPLNGLYFS